MRQYHNESHGNYLISIQHYYSSVLGFFPGKEISVHLESDSVPMSKIMRHIMRVCLLLLAPALIAWLTGRPFIFPSLGPSAYSLAINGRDEATGRRVICGHLIGVLSGLLAYHMVAHGLALSVLPSAQSIPLLRLAASGVISVVLTTAGMLAAKAQHPPACATTMIISLGILATSWDAIFIMLAVAVMYAVHKFLSPAQRAESNRADGDSH